MDVYPREAVRVKVRKYEPNAPSEWRKFSVDPQITTLEVLYSLLAKAFDIKSDFSIKYKAFDPAGNEIYLSVLSDWDLDAAFLRIHNHSIQTSAEPCLVLQIDVKPFTEIKECDAETLITANTKPTLSNATTTNTNANAREIMTPLQQSLGVSQKYVQHMQTRLPGLIINQMEKTFSMVQKAFNLSEETMSTLPPRLPLSDTEFRLFLDALGQIQRTDELRKVIFFGGIEPGLRRVVWKHILNVYPNGMNGHQRMDYMRRKSEQYYKLRETWKHAVKQGCVVGELGYVTSMVKKDVLRTDRLNPFYAGSDDNQNIASLFNILTTFALNHPTVSYCQGMSDIASPLLVTMNDEAQAYICFCAIMFRVRGNFMLDGIAMTQKFAHLSEALSVYDPEFWEYLKSQQADDLLFCYRWLLLELKREFPFDDALRMLEVQWSSLKYDTTVNNELSLYEKEFVAVMETTAPTTASSLSSSLSTTGGGPTSPSYLVTKPRENPYTKFCALRRQSSTASLSSLSSSLGSTNALDTSKRLNQSLDDNISRHVLTRRQRQVSSKAHQSLDEAKMLMLIESSEKDVTTSVLQLNPKGDDDDASSIKNPAENIESSHFQFHPTNPFKDDAQQIEGSTTAAATTDKPISRVFLNSTSSSITEDDHLVGNDDSTNTANQLPNSIAKLQNKNILTNYNTVSNIIAKQLANATTVSETMKRVGCTGGGHFKDLKEKIAATSKKGLSFEELTNTANTGVKPQQKLVKNFNEFLNFATVNKSRIADKFTSTNTLLNQEKLGGKSNVAVITSPQSPQSPTLNTQILLTHPVVQLTKSSRVPSLEDSDSTSSFPDTTWSNSTAATAIQQAQNLSCNSLHLELISMSSANYSYTPDRTPVAFSPLRNELANDAYVNVMPEENPDIEQEYYPLTTAMTRELRLEADNLDRQVFGDNVRTTIGDIEYEKLEKETTETLNAMDELNLKENEIIACADINELLKRKKYEKRIAAGGDYGVGNRIGLPKSKSNINYRLDFEESDDDDSNDEVFKEAEKSRFTTKTATSFDSASTSAFNMNPFVDDSLYSTTTAATKTTTPAMSIPNSNSLPEVLVPISTDRIDIGITEQIEIATNAVDDEEQIGIQLMKHPDSLEINGIGIDSSSSTTLPSPPVLPPPHQFGGGNPFLMFLCLTLLLQHRNTIIKSGMDYNEIAMHFDKMVRKHDVTRVLNQARRMYIDYLKVQNAYKQRMQQAATLARGTKKFQTKTTHHQQQSQQLQQQ